jgi:hypothetical protein
VEFQSQFAIGFLDVIGIGVFGDGQNFVMGSFGSGEDFLGTGFLVGGEGSRAGSVSFRSGVFLIKVKNKQKVLIKVRNLRKRNEVSYLVDLADSP